MLKNSNKFSDKTFDSLIFLPVKIGNETVTAMFDTGASLSVITKTLAGKLNCKTNRSLSCGNNNGKTFKMDGGTLNSVKIDNCKIENALCGIVPDEYFEFGTDDKGNVFPAQMFLGWDIISRFCWRIDMKNKLYSVSEIGAGNAVTSAKENNLTYNRFPAIKVQYKSDFALFGFDTGHTETLLDCSWRFKLDNAELAGTEITGVGSSLTEQVFTARNFEFKFEGQPFRLKQATVLQHNIFGSEENTISGLLGIDFFENSIFEIDFKNKRFHIEKY